MTKLYVEYAQDGIKLSDEEAFNFSSRCVDLIKGSQPNAIKVSNSIAILSIRVAIKRGEIDLDDIVLLFNNGPITIEKDGAIHHWPIGFCDHVDILFEELFMGA